MRTARPLAISLLALAAAGCAGTGKPDDRVARGEAEIATRFAGITPGKPVNCIPLDRSRGSEIVDATAILYNGFGRRTYVNRPRGGCPSLREQRIIVTNVYGNQLCRGDIIRLVEPSGGGGFGSCVLGDFIPYERPAAQP